MAKEIAHRRTVDHRTAGCLVFRDGEVLLLRKRGSGEWVFPKGHVEPGETARQAAEREVREEAGIDVSLEEALGRTHYRFISGNGLVENRKSVEWFRATWTAGQPKPEADTFAEACFLEPGEALRLLTFGDDRSLLERSLRTAS